jgi:hypothetical protein
MKTITLNTATADNSNARRDAGETLTIGDAPDAIALARAEALVEAASATVLEQAEAETAPAKPAKKAD